jgi:ATP-dependent RNA circularization protein (DNA/RNA ligase family)
MKKKSKNKTYCRFKRKSAYGVDTTDYIEIGTDTYYWHKERDWTECAHETFDEIYSKDVDEPIKHNSKTKIVEHYGIPYTTLHEWSKRDSDNWRNKIYRLLRELPIGAVKEEE